MAFSQIATSGVPKKRMSAIKGFKTYGETSVAAMIKEFTQLTKGTVPKS